MSYSQGAPTTNPYYQSVQNEVVPPMAMASLPLLQPLIGQDTLLVKQKKDMLEIFTGWESHNRYEIYDRQGRTILYAVEDTDTFAQCCFSNNRPFCIRVIDSNKQQVSLWVFRLKISQTFDI